MVNGPEEDRVLEDDAVLGVFTHVRRPRWLRRLQWGIARTRGRCRAEATRRPQARPNAMETHGFRTRSALSKNRESVTGGHQAVRLCS